MVVERTRPTASQVEVLDRVLDKGVVIDAWIRVAVMGIDLITVQARVVVASIETYLESSDALTAVDVASPANPTMNALTITSTAKQARMRIRGRTSGKEARDD